MEDILQADRCFSLRQLALSGRDLTAMGITGPAVGRTLNALLDKVVEEEVPNEPAVLLRTAAELNGLKDPGAD